MAEKKLGRILSGMQPTSNLHLGNYLGALKNWVALQHDYECFFFIVDQHAITVDWQPKELKERVFEVAASYIAAGIDTDKCYLFPQSAVPAHTELFWYLNCLTPMGWLNRMTQFKEKAGKHKEQASGGLYTYPVLQAADILIYKATQVPVGEDQKQHIELARDIAGTFNHKVGHEYFPLPEPKIMGVATRIMSLRDGTKKMSKSDISEYSRISLSDSADDIAQKIRKAKTDMDLLPDQTAGLEGRPEASNLLNIYAALSDQSLESVLQHFAGKQFSDLKKELIDLTVEKMSPINKQFQLLMSDRAELKNILQRGADKANEIATVTIKEVRELLGMWT